MEMCAMQNHHIIEFFPTLRWCLMEGKMKESMAFTELPVGQHGLSLEGSWPCLPCCYSIGLHTATVLLNPANETSALNRIVHQLNHCHTVSLFHLLIILRCQKAMHSQNLLKPTQMGKGMVHIAKGTLEMRDVWSLGQQYTPGCIAFL